MYLLRLLRCRTRTSLPKSPINCQSMVLPASGPILALTNRINWEEMIRADRTSQNFICFIICSLLPSLFIRRLPRDRLQMMELIMTAPDLMLTQRTQSQALYSDYRNRWELHMQGRKKGRVSSASPGCKQSSF